MALPKEIPPSWLNVPVQVAVASPIPRKDGSLDFPSFPAKILADYPEVVELEMSDCLRLYPKNMVAYLRKDKTIVAPDTPVLLLK